MKRFKSMLSLLLAVVMMMGAVPVGAGARTSTTVTTTDNSESNASAVGASDSGSTHAPVNFSITDMDYTEVTSVEDGGTGYTSKAVDTFFYLNLSENSGMYTLGYLIDYPESFVSITSDSFQWIGSIWYQTSLIYDDYLYLESDLFQVSNNCPYYGGLGGLPIGENGNAYIRGGLYTTSYDCMGVQYGGKLAMFKLRLDRMPQKSQCLRDDVGYYLPLGLQIYQFNYSLGGHTCSQNACTYGYDENGNWYCYSEPYLTATSGKLYIYREQSYSVKFYDNIDNSSVYAEQFVAAGDYAQKPTDPVRAGYIFKGWYANPSCQGEAWFNSANGYKGRRITADLNLYARFTPIGEFVREFDFFSFENFNTSFIDSTDKSAHQTTVKHDEETITVYTMKLNYMLTGNYRDAANTLGIIPILLNWKGACFGMSCTAALLFSGKLDVGFFQSNAETTHDLDAPVNNHTIRNLIMYYHLMQSSPRTWWATHNYHALDERVNCQMLIEALDSSEYPVVLTLGIYNKLGFLSPTSQHAVLAIGYIESGRYYRVRIIDPNQPNSVETISISKEDFSKDICTLGYDVYIEGSLTLEDSDYDFKNIQDYLTGRGYTDGGSAREVVNPETYMNTDLYSFRIDSSSGKFAIIENGIKVAGELDISNGVWQNELGFESDIRYTLSMLSDGESYTITPGENISFLTDEPLEEYNIMMVISTYDSTVMTSICADPSVSVCFDNNGKAETLSETVAAQSVNVYRSDLEQRWCALTASAETTGMTAEATASGVTVTCADDADFNITVFSDNNEVGFDDIAVGAAGITVTDDENGNVVIINNENATVADQSELCCALLFCTMGGNEIETQYDIPYGGTAIQPEDPVRPGMIFGGWYSTYECADGTEWSFDTPITEDTFIYAKWIIDDNYLCLVTFRAEGCDDVSYLVLNGDALTGDVQPEIPEKEGYMAEWPEVDLSCITDDIVIEAVYTPVTASGVCGDGVRWAYSNELGKLWIYGSGEMDDYSSANVPWYDFMSDVREIEIARGVTGISDHAFCNHRTVESVVIPNSVTSIGNGAFLFCHALTSIVIPDSVTEMGIMVFGECSSLTSAVLSNSLTCIPPLTFMECTALSSVLIPDSVTCIGESAFEGCCSLGDVEIPDSVTVIESGAFWMCSSLSSITIPDSVTVIEDSVFLDCTSLRYAYIGKGVVSLDLSAFTNCHALLAYNVDLDNLNYSSSEGVLFSKDGTALLLYPQGRTGAYAVPGIVTSIAGSAFMGCGAITEVNIPASVTGIGNRNFLGCIALTDINVAQDNPQYTSVNGSLYDKDVTTLICYPGGRAGELILPDSVNTIADYAAISSGYLTSLTFPEGIAYIGEYAFASCHGLESAVFLGDPPEYIGQFAFEDNYQSGFSFYYTESHADAWAPIIDHNDDWYDSWNGYPIQMIADPQPTIPLGDANGDGVIAFADVAELYSVIFAGSAFTPAQQRILDVNGDGAVSFADVAALYNYVLTGQTA